MIIEEMDTSIGKEAEYTTLIQQASSAYLNRQYNAALCKYNNALLLSSELKASKMTKTILKYMICLCLMESNKLQDLAEVVMMMQTVEKSLKHRFPDIYCLLAKAHCKLYRFDEANAAIKEGTTVYKNNQLLETFYIPGTHIAINETDEDIWLKIREECLTWHKPDATCNLPDCCNITAPYVTANKNIFLKDPAFNGMVIVHCNNKKRPCSLKFHQCCWKFKKDQMYPFEKVSDKDILGNRCFTPNCVNEDVPCIVSAIEVVGQNGEVKAHIKESTSVTWPVHKNSISKGAIKKVKLNTPNKTENPFEKEKHPVTIKEEDFDDKKKRCNNYEEDQILAVTDYLAEVDFSYESPDRAGEKNFLFSMFHDYIQNNLVRVGDAYKKFTEIREDLIFSKDIDIIEFLLHTNKIYVLSNKTVQNFLPSQNQENFKTSVKTERVDRVNLNKTIDIEDMYNELMDDDYDYCEKADDFPLVKPLGNNKNSPVDDFDQNHKLILNVSNSNFSYAQGGANPLQNSKNVATNCTSYNFPCENRSNEPEKKASENRKLKEYIEKLELDMNNLIDKNSELEKELRMKNTEIIKLTKEQKEYATKLDNVCENMKVFQIRYDEIKEENLQFKKEMISVLQDKKALEEKLLEIDDSDSKKKEVLKMFQDEYKILEDHINASWQEKMDELEKILKDQKVVNKSLLNKCINYKYSSNRNIIKGHIDQCTSVLEVISKINMWMESTLNIKNFTDNAEWLSRLSFLNKNLANYQNEYSEILEKLVSDQIEDADITINIPVIPNPPSVSVSELVQNVLNTFYKGQCHVMQSALKLQQQSMAYQMPVNNVPFNQFSQQYPYGSAYSPSRSPLIANSLMPPPLMNFQMPRMSVPLPMMQQSYVQLMHHSPKFVDASNGNVEKSVDSASVNFMPDSSSSEDAASKIKNPTISEDEIEQEKKETEKKEKKAHTNENTTFEKEEKVKSIDQRSTRNEKIAKTKKTCKAIASDIHYDDKGFDISSNKKVSNYDSIKEQESNIDNKENVELSSLELACLNSTRNSAVNSSYENTVKPKKKIGVDALIQLMKQKYPESLEIEIIEAISNIRRRHNNSLTKVPVNLILQESDEFMTQKHNLHTLRYIKIDGNKPSHNETSAKSSGVKQNEKKTEISPVSSCASLNKLEENPVQKKKAWNTIAQSEVQWSSSGEIECSICMSLVINSDNCYTLSCRHSFHKQCVKSWLKSDRSCPNCRIAVTEDDEFPPLPA